MTKEQQIKVCTLHEQQSIKPTTKHANTELGINYQPK